ncbi:uncharacterized protein YbjT (DUF2867 family) [Phyllobacterium ifriqiyense]|uniref:Uncharacterized protein YbjT (DUF2867 family) n=1 Tax=Phyllobacterium ifriqiyense TaxID=314238 RepID=A0ABU0S3C3_9HYPH|nr:SDR family oxidoreductase [Phyllobacterium ifriqiyense]MDQ0995214.1 uncharacterized protein YbjT (DUF2867 family) [Phyllobacterium ifriqiyense]
MNILVLGATGLIGSSICADLVTAGHKVVAGVRATSDPLPPGITRVVKIDLAKLIEPELWAPVLSDVDIVINCAGTLQDGPGEDTRGVHIAGPAALFGACAAAKVRRVIHFSAMGVNKEQPTAFSRTKLAAEENLISSDLDWVILRPSVVLGSGVFGASALFRALAALPWVPIVPGTGKLQVVLLSDVVDTVSHFISLENEGCLAIDLAGPEAMDIAAVIAAYRKWYGWPPAKSVVLPTFATKILFGLGDLAGALGWRPPMRSTAALEAARGAVGDPGAWTMATGIRPASLGVALRSSPASVQERWFAKLYFIKAVIFVILPMFWIATGLISLSSGYQIGIELMQRGGAGIFSAPAVIAGALADIAVGALMAYRPLTRWGLRGAIFLCLFYALAGTIILPELWREPLGPLLKIWPILLLHFVALAILKER